MQIRDFSILSRVLYSLRRFSLYMFTAAVGSFLGVLTFTNTIFVRLEVETVTEVANFTRMRD